MARYKAGIVPPFIGTRHNITICNCRGIYVVRTKSSLTGSRVKEDKAFRTTMQYAGWLGHASGIASGIYRSLPAATKQFSLFRTLTGEAMQLLKEGISEAEIIKMLCNKYLPKKSTRQSRTRTGKKVNRIFEKRTVKRMASPKSCKDRFILFTILQTHYILC
jgi:hypothetical protein